MKYIRKFWLIFFFKIHPLWGFIAHHAVIRVKVTPKLFPIIVQSVFFLSSFLEKKKKSGKGWIKDSSQSSFLKRSRRWTDVSFRAFNNWPRLEFRTLFAQSFCLLILRIIRPPSPLLLVNFISLQLRFGEPWSSSPSHPSTFLISTRREAVIYDLWSTKNLKIRRRKILNPTICLDNRIDRYFSEFNIKKVTMKPVDFVFIIIIIKKQIFSKWSNWFSNRLMFNYWV